jgi:hypothetical protein
MRKFRRRAFLRKAVFTTFMLGSFIPKSHAISILNGKDSFDAPNIEALMLKAYLSWVKTFDQSPTEFLNSSNQKPVVDISISYTTAEEFKNGHTFEFNGIILSKTEAALILDSYFS